MRRVFQFFRQDVLLITLSLLLMGLSIGANLLKPWPVALLVDSVFGSLPFPEFLQGWVQSWDKPLLVLVLCLGAFGLHAGQGALNALQNYLAIRAGLRGLSRVRNTLFNHLLGLPPSYHDTRNQGDLIYRATWDSFGFQTLFQQGVFTLLSASASVVVMIFVMWNLNHLLTLISLATIPLIAMSILRFGDRMKRTGAVANAADSAVSTLIQQGITTVALTQSFTLEEREKKRFGLKVTDALIARARQHGWELAYWMVITVVFGLGTSAIAWFGSGLVLDGALTVGQLLIFLAYLAQFYEPLNQLSHLGRTVSDASSSTTRVFEVLDARSPLADGSFDQKARARGDVSFQNVDFAYRPGNPVLSGVSFELPSGRSLAVIGPSGAGKSTLIQLLLRFHDPQGGVIRLDGRDLRDFRLRSLRGEMALVPQETQLLPATVAENIACGRPGASRAEIEAAAESARAMDFIHRLPQGFDTPVGEGLARMSVGERQRLNIARAFLRDAPVLLLDEPTSALDTETERAVVDSLDRLMVGRTTIMVTHRPSTLRNVDLVLALEAGKIRFFGPKAQAFAADGGLSHLLISTAPPT